VSLLALAIFMTSILQPGAEVKHREFIEAVAELGGTPERVSELLVFAADESRMGDALSGKRWDSKAYCELQVRGSPALEGNPRECVRAWLRIRARSAEACGEAKALAGLASGRCDRGTRLADARAAEARWLLLVAQLALR
jgi:hypothetical protein